MKGRLFSPGKLLLTSEYAVLDGALALAVPTRLGQDFFYTEGINGRSRLMWEALHQGQPWLMAEIDYHNWEVIKTNLPDAAAFVVKVLQNVQQLSSAKFQGDTDYCLTTNLQFPADYGLGSSSTLMANLAAWAGVDAFQLNDMSLGGSGYDVAVAQHGTSILFTNIRGERACEIIDYHPPFIDELVLVHLNQKQNSREGIALYRSKRCSGQLIVALTELTNEVLLSQNISTFSALMTEHEKLLSDFIGLEPVRTKIFPGCPVFVKSLGAWGGDFVLTCKFEGYETYFSDIGYTTVLNYSDIVR